MSTPSQSSLFEECKCGKGEECNCGNDANSEFQLGYFGGDNIDNINADDEDAVIDSSSDSSSDSGSDSGSDSSSDSDADAGIDENKISGGFDGDFAGGSYDRLIGGELNNLYIGSSEFSDINNPNLDEFNLDEFNLTKSTGAKNIERIGGDYYGSSNIDNDNESDNKSDNDNESVMDINKSDNDNESVMDINIHDTEANSDSDSDEGDSDSDEGDSDSDEGDSDSDEGDSDSDEGDSDKPLDSDNESIMDIDDNQGPSNTKQTRDNNLEISGGSNDMTTALNNFLSQVDGIH